MPALELPIVVPAVRLDQDATAEEAAALRRAKAPWLAGFLVFGGEAEQVRRLTARLRDAARRPVFVASDMERGAGQQVKGLATLPDAAVWGLGGTPEDAEAFGEITARDARSVGVDVLFAPVLDVRSEPSNPIVGNRAFGWDPARVALLGAAYCRGATRGGALPTAKHYPGHGATTADSHDAIPVVLEPEAKVRARDLQPFVDVVRAGCPAVMTAHVAYPALDRSGAIATFSPRIVSTLRDALDAEQDVAVFTDALLMAGALGAGSEAAAARLALAAGCDAMLYPSDPEGLAAHLLDEDAAGLRDAVETAASRMTVLAGTAERAGRSVAHETKSLRSAPPRVAARALEMAGGAALAPETGWVVVLDDDGKPERGRVLSERGRRAGVPVTVVRSKDGPVLEKSPVASGWTVVVMSSVRAWKGASNLSPAGQDVLDRLLERAGSRTRVVWLSPLARGGDVHVPGMGDDVEAALADRLFRPAT
jgi:beta-glucosidase-like glycosyl hydrolase